MRYGTENGTSPKAKQVVPHLKADLQGRDPLLFGWREDPDKGLLLLPLLPDLKLERSFPVGIPHRHLIYPCACFPAHERIHPPYNLLATANLFCSCWEDKAERRQKRITASMDITLC